MKAAAYIEFGLFRVSAVLDPVTATLTPCVREIVEEAFLQAFQGQGGVKMDQARFVLAAHIGLSFDPEKFATLRVDDAEIPGILEAFYKIFTDDFLVTQVCTSLQNKMAQSPQAESRKQLVSCLRPLGMLETFGLQEDGSGTLNKEDASALLKKTGLEL